ncbi:MAG: type 2 isopentenyl-diphosphate Delta-isomerase [Leptolinea sp.]
MPDSSHLSNRKGDHIRINLEEDVQSSLSTGLEDFQFVHCAIPEINLKDVDISTKLWNKNISAPMLISSMTGGTEKAGEINCILARAAQKTGVALGIGSQRVGLDHPELAETFRVRKVAPDILLFANLGAIQLNYTYSVDHCRRAVEMIEADALFLHLNALQEAIQPEGDTCFAGLLQKIEAVCKGLTVPVVIKEVGWGISAKDAARLVSAGVAAIDVAGAGGTSWSQVEMYRVEDPHQAKVAGAFRGWGIPTAQSIQQVCKAAPGLPVFASGGLRDGIDIAKCLALGAALGGMASPLIKAASVSEEETVKVIQEIQREIQISLFACGCKDIAALQTNKDVLVKKGEAWI